MTSLPAGRMIAGQRNGASPGPKAAAQRQLSHHERASQTPSVGSTAWGVACPPPMLCRGCSLTVRSPFTRSRPAPSAASMTRCSSTENARSGEGFACPFRPLLSPSHPHVSASAQGICVIGLESGGDGAVAAVAARCSVLTGVEHICSWLLGCRRLGVCYEWRADLPQGLLHLACALLCLRVLSPSEAR